jgi:hypothetical protein
LVSPEEAACLTEIRRSRVQPSDDVPTLKRDLFASEEEWQAARKVDDLRRGADPLMNRWQRLMP